MMLRRDFVAGLSGAAVAWPVAGQAQQAAPVRRVGVIGPESLRADAAFLAPFRRRLEEHGWREGKTIAYIDRFATSYEGLGVAVADLVAANPDVIFAVSRPAMTALHQSTSTIPVVFVETGDPVRLGFVASLARPGGNATGFTTFEIQMGGKWVGLLKEMAPDIDHVAALFNLKTGDPGYLEPARKAAASLGVALVDLRVRDAADLATAIAAFSREPRGGLFIVPDPFTIDQRGLIVDLAAQYRLPAVYWSDLFAESGALLSYGIDQTAEVQGAADYVDRILRGAKPADLPVQAPTKFHLIVNAKTAKAIGLTIPMTILARADEVIE